MKLMKNKKIIGIVIFAILILIIITNFVNLIHKNNYKKKIKSILK